MRINLSKRQTIVIISAVVICLAVAVPLIVVAIKRYKISMKTSNNLGDKSLPRGYRNNNPLNIRITGERWIGKVSPNTDGSFEQFESMGYGFRAALKTIQNYISKGYNTIEKIITRWAPPQDNNNTTSYIANVASRTGISKTQEISRSDREKLISIVYAMAISENGSAPQRSDIEAGWDMI